MTESTPSGFDEAAIRGSNGHSRATFLRGAALGGGALLGSGALGAVRPAAANAHDASGGPSDLDILNYALTLEHLEATFYTQGLKVFGFFDFLRARYPRGFGLERLRVRDRFKEIRDHEQAHVATLITVIEDVLGGEAVPPCEYNFEETAFTSIDQFISVAQTLENTGVMAYDGAIAYVEQAELLTAGATIATVEARHASYLNLINGDSPFPDAFDTPKAPQEICKLVDDLFIVSCPFDLEAFCASLPDEVIALGA